MNIQQLRYICTIARSGFSVSKSAAQLHTSQPAVSQQLRALEDELGLQVFVRDRHRLVGLTPQGQQILAHAESALAEIGSIRGLAKVDAEKRQERLVIATTHTQARYVLPTVLKAFAEKHPPVELVLTHGNPAEVTEHLIAGTAHIGVIQVTQPSTADILMLEARRFRRVVVVPRRHPLLRVKPLTLAAIAEYPLITYEQTNAARRQVFRIFEEAGLKPHVILDAIDADVIKACVARELGITILPEVAVTAADKSDLRTIDAGHLFPPSVSGLAIHRRHHLSDYAWDMLELFAPQWKRSDIERLRSGTARAATREEPVSTPAAAKPAKGT
ncbi:MAG: LysR family transcriptional regulator [Betaproteobacteria bacterium]|nr:MAG: LysR family transcriptional regulator [Betaproteobacteria bacterium]